MLPTARWRVPDLGTAIAALVLAGAGSAASAQTQPDSIQLRGDPPCILDKCLRGGVAPSRPAEPEPAADEPTAAGRTSAGRYAGQRATASGSFDFYVLALSWSPGFCETGGGEQARQQCDPGTKLGFVVHGLWPQNQHGYPSDCNGNAPNPSRVALDSVRGLYPDEGLARHEWRKHGTCTGLSPTEYFAAVRRAREAIAIPPKLQAPTDQQNWVPLDIARAFVAANPRLRTDSMAVTCRQNMLQEVRICFTRDLRGFIPCPEVSRASCRRPIEVPPVL